MSAAIGMVQEILEMAKVPGPRSVQVSAVEVVHQLLEMVEVPGQRSVQASAAIEMVH